MIDKQKVVEGAVRKTAPCWLAILILLLAITRIPNDYIQGALVFVVVVLLVATAYVTGFTEALKETTPMINDASDYMEEAATVVNQLTAPFTLTGGGPLDGDTVPNPADTPPRLLVYDPENEELEGSYVADPMRPNVLIWEPVEDDDDAS